MSREHALSFASVAEAYDRARPSYPEEAVTWLVGSGQARVVELGAGTGKLTEMLVAAGHEVVAVDPLPQMLGRLRERAPGATAVMATAEQVPLPSRWADVVVCAQSFHWFDHGKALPEAVRLLRPGGVLALVWNTRDEGIPWVRRLGRIIGADAAARDELVDPVIRSDEFGWVAQKEFRFWQSLRREELVDLVRSRSYVATMGEAEREDVLEQVRALYDDYGRGPDGLQLPYVTRCFRSVVKHRQPPPPPRKVAAPAAAGPGAGVPRLPTQAPPPEDSGTLLIDFR